MTKDQRIYKAQMKSYLETLKRNISGNKADLKNNLDSVSYFQRQAKHSKQAVKRSEAALKEGIKTYNSIK